MIKRKLYNSGLDLMTTTIVLIILAGVLAYIINIIGNLRTVNVNEYLNNYSNYLQRSAIEYSIAIADAADYSKSCPTKIHISDPYFDINGYYHFFLTDCSNCKNCTKIDTKDINGSFYITLELKSKIPGYPVRKIIRRLENP